MSRTRTTTTMAANMIRGDILRTPILSHPVIDATIDGRVFLKAESLQYTNSFKIRGATVKVKLSTADHMVTASAGNHGQGVAASAGEAGKIATVFVPACTPQNKIDRIRRLGASVIVEGEDFDEANSAAYDYARAAGRQMIPPFDDWDVIAGQGTVIREQMEEIGTIDTVVVQVGGGGLAAGTALALEEIRSKAELICVEPAALPSLTAAVEHGAPISVPASRSFAEGAAVRQVGDLPFSVLCDRIGGVVRVTEPEIGRAIQWLYQEMRLAVEGAGALSVAALLSGRLDQLVKGRVAMILSGGNIDADAITRAS